MQELIGSLSIMGHTWDVYSYQPGYESDGSWNLGFCYHSKQQIWVATHDPVGNELSNSTRRHTFLHEVSHAVDYYAGTNLSEEQVDAFSTVFFQMLVANPGLLQAIEGA